VNALRLVALLALATSANGQTVRVRQASGDIVDLPIERYVAGVLVGESSVFQSPAALRAMAVAARTYAVRMRGRHAAEGYDFCTTTHCQRWESTPPVPRLTQAAADTAGELLWFAGKPAFTPYTRDCGGRSEDAAAVWPDLAAPYLRVHDDPYCGRAGTPPWQWSCGARQMADALLRSSLRTPPTVEHVAIAARTASGRAETLVLAGGGESVRLAAGSLRFALGRELGWNTVRSDLYQVHSEGGRIVFEGRGSGHGVGLCQLGADRMGMEGRTYRDILAFYYPGTRTGVTAKEIPWQRIGGETMTLFTANPSQDGAVLALAERLLRAAAQRTGWRAPQRVEIYLYPDLDSFRNATGEPGWVAAYTTGARIRLQPAETLRSRGALESTLRHELLHVLVESQARTGLPFWFREGVVEYLANPPAPGEVARIPSDADLRQTTDPARARRAYEASAHAVADIAHRYGEAAVLSWVARGLPPEVTDAVTRR
jgi:stage II sporulation protein D